MANSSTIDRKSHPNEGKLRDLERFEEVWEGVNYMPPAANTEHARVCLKITSIFSSMIDWDAGEQAVSNVNVSDRDQDWMSNYRIPDSLVILRNGRAVDRGPYILGGPDIVVEVISEGEDPLAKHPFYESIGVREFVVIERDPWAVELFRLQSNRLVSIGRSDGENGAVLDSAVLPVRYRVVPGTSPLRVEVTNRKTNQTWNLAG